MKRILFIAALLISSLSLQALTVKELLTKYRNMPDVQYHEIKGKELKEAMDSVDTEAEREILRTAKQIITSFTVNKEETFPMIIKDLNSIKDYSLALSYSTKEEEYEKHNIQGLLSMVLGGDDFDSVYIEVYSKNSSSSEYLLKPILAIKFWGFAGIVYIDGKIKPDDTKNFVKVTTNVNISTDTPNSSE